MKLQYWCVFCFCFDIFSYIFVHSLHHLWTWDFCACTRRVMLLFSYKKCATWQKYKIELLGSFFVSESYTLFEKERNYEKYNLTDYESGFKRYVHPRKKIIGVFIAIQKHTYHKFWRWEVFRNCNSQGC